MTSGFVTLNLGTWQMGTFWLETVLISYEVEGVLLAIGSNPADGSTDGKSFVFSSNVLKLSLFLAGGSIAGFETADWKW